MHLVNYLGYLHKAELHLAEAFRKVGEGHAAEADVYHTCNTLAKQCEAHAPVPAWGAGGHLGAQEVSEAG